jgi:hypothetical protein
MRRVVMLLALLTPAGCGDEESAPVPSVTINCIRGSNVTNTCANGDNFADDEDDSDGGASAGAGTGGADASKQKTCIGFAPYTGSNTPCNFDAECPVSQNPCEIQVCGAASVCTTVPSAPGTRFCGEDLVCEFSLCCTL